MKTRATIQNVTNQNKIASLLNLSVIVVIVLMLSGCFAHTPHRHGNPHYNYHDNTSLQVSIQYFYYPGLHVYYDSHQHLYHYHDKHRGWLTVNVLPSYIRLHGQRHHIIHSKHNTPWKLNHRYKRPHSHVAPNQHRPHNDQQRPHNDQHRPSNGQHRPNNGQDHSQQRPNQNQHYRPVPKPLQKPHHDEQRRWRQKKQPSALTPRQPAPQKRQKKEQKIKQQNKDNQSNDDGKVKSQQNKKTHYLKKRYE